MPCASFSMLDGSGGTGSFLQSEVKIVHIVVQNITYYSARSRWTKQQHNYKTNSNKITEEYEYSFKCCIISKLPPKQSYLIQGKPSRLNVLSPSHSMSGRTVQFLFPFSTSSYLYPPNCNTKDTN